MMWLNLYNIGEISILQSAQKQGNPSFHIHAPGSKRRYPCTQTASAVPKYTHLEPESEKQAKNVDITQLKLFRNKQHVFAVPVYCSLICTFHILPAMAVWAGLRQAILKRHTVETLVLSVLNWIAQQRRTRFGDSLRERLLH